MRAVLPVVGGLDEGNVPRTAHLIRAGDREYANRLRIISITDNSRNADVFHQLRSLSKSHTGVVQPRITRPEIHQERGVEYMGGAKNDLVAVAFKIPRVNGAARVLRKIAR